jgi:hypothetical protein
MIARLGENTADAISYFRNNAVSDISTFEEKLILQKLREASPEKVKESFTECSCLNTPGPSVHNR